MLATEFVSVGIDNARHVDKPLRLTLTGRTAGGKRRAAHFTLDDWDLITIHDAARQAVKERAAAHRDRANDLLLEKTP